MRTYSVYVYVLGHGRCTPCRLRAAGDEIKSAKPSATRKMAHRERPSTAGSGREIGATAHPTLPTAGNGRLGHVHVISSGSAGARTGERAPGGRAGRGQRWQRRGPTALLLSQGGPERTESARQPAGGHARPAGGRDGTRGASLGGPWGAWRRIGSAKRMGGE